MSQTVFPNDVLIAGNLQAGTMSLPLDSVGTAQIQPQAVGASELTSTLATGFLPLSLHAAREIFSNDYGNAATAAATGSGGVLAKDTTPVLERVNAATDKQTRVKWAAGNTDELQWQVISPPDLDGTQPVTVKAYALSGGGTDTPALTVGLWEGIGGSDLGGATGALSNTAAVVSRACTVTATAGTPKPWSITLKPGTHGSDDAQVLAVWVEYSRK